MNQKITLLFEICLIGLSVLLSGCGGGGGTNNSTPFTVAMSLAPAATSFPMAINDADVATVSNAFWIARTEVTHQLWATVYNWATSNGYTFANAGSRGGYYDTSYKSYTSAHEIDPVTQINWRDAIVWCNALTEYYNAQNRTSYACVYRSGASVIRDSTSATCDIATADAAAKGFRLPTSAEWELAARYQGSDSSNGAISADGKYWTPGSYASGATAISTLVNLEATKLVAWFYSNSNTPDSSTYSTQSVGGKTANKLGLYDMNGNVWEWCFDLSSTNRVIRGGCFGSDFTLMALGYTANETPTSAYSTLGFRLVRTE